MSENRFVFTGLEEMREALRRLPEEFTEEARELIQSRALGAVEAIAGVYERHAITHHLARSVVVVEERSPFGFALLVKVMDPIAWLFDNGSAARHWISTGQSTGTMWGPAGGTHIFVKTMINARAALWGDLADLLRRAGLVVSGRAE